MTSRSASFTHLARVQVTRFCGSDWLGIRLAIFSSVFKPVEWLGLGLALTGLSDRMRFA